MGCLVSKKEGDLPEASKSNSESNKDRLFTVREASADLEVTNQQKTLPRAIS